MEVAAAIEIIEVLDFGIPWWVAAPVTLALLLVAALNREALRTYFGRSVVFTVGHIATGAFLMGMLFAIVVNVSHLNRESLGRDRDERLQQNNALIRRLIKLESPTTAELARLSQNALRVCSRTAECRAAFTATVNRVLTVTSGRIVPAPGGQGSGPASPRPDVVRPRPAPAPRQPLPAPVPVRPVQPSPDRRISEALQRLQVVERRVAALQERRPVDSTALKTIDNTVRALEQTVGVLTGRVNGLLQGLCAPAVARLLNLLRLCA